MLTQDANLTPTAQRRSLRDRVSDRVNRLTWRLMRAYDVRLSTGRGSYRLVHALRRFQLAFIESHFVDVLKRRWRPPSEHPVTVDLSAFVRERPRWRHRLVRGALLAALVLPILVLLPRAWALAVVLAGLVALPRTRATVGRLASRVRLRLRTRWLRSGKRPGAVEGVRRLIFVDAMEMKRSHIGGRPYCYHKYLEGLVDFDRMDIEADTRVVLYGDLDVCDEGRVRHDRVMVLEAHADPKRTVAIGPLIEQAVWESWFDAGGIDPGLVSLLASRRKHLEILMRLDLQMIEAAENLLARFPQPLEICLDSFDSTLFSLGQHLLEAYPQHTVTALQKVLGPYTFSYNIRGGEGLVRQPHRIVTWGAFHDEALRSLGYTCPLEPSRLFKLNAYLPFLSLDRDDIKRRAGLPLDRPVVMVSVVQRIVDFPLVDRLEYVQMLTRLAALANADRCFVLFKPWPGEDPSTILSIAQAGFTRNWTLMQSAQGERFHNVELLRITDVIVSTLSSFIGEAVFFGAVPVLVDTPAAQTYFTRTYTDVFRQMCYPARASVAETVEAALSLDADGRTAWRASIEPMYARVFGTAP